MKYVPSPASPWRAVPTGCVNTSPRRETRTGMYCCSLTEEGRDRLARPHMLRLSFAIVMSRFWQAD